MYLQCTSLLCLVLYHVLIELIAAFLQNARQKTNLLTFKLSVSSLSSSLFVFVLSFWSV